MEKYYIRLCLSIVKCLHLGQIQASPLNILLTLMYTLRVGCCEQPSQVILARLPLISVPPFLTKVV
jgi:hypothetical protein